jgi:hypothetical protein
MVLTKSIEYFDPVNVKGKCHIIGCGSVGSTVAALLARLGVTKFVLYDFDRVEAHNLANQMFIHKDIKTEKVDAVKRIITEINPDAEPTIEICREGYNDQKLNGYVFLCVDNIDLRREICQKNRLNRMIKAVFDFRTRLEDAQHYAANWADMKQVDNLIKTMDFSHDEAHAATPVTACGTELGVAPTVWVVCSLGVCNFMNLIRGVPLKNIVVCNPFAMDIF